MRIAVIGFVTTLLALAVLVSSPSGTAYGQADACGVLGFDVPDSGANFDFSAACAAHDACYAAHHGEGEAARKACDDQFLADMRESCASLWPNQPLRRALCNSVARTYYSAVRIGGWLFFYG